MNFIKRFIIKTAARLVREPVEAYFDEIGWTNEDANGLGHFLKTDQGKKLLGTLSAHSNKCLARIVSCKPEELESIKAEAKAWNAVKAMLQMHRIEKIDALKDKLNDKQLDEIFANMVTSSSRLSNSVLLQTR